MTAAIPRAARILATADVWAALKEPRPHRPALEPSHAARRLEQEAKAGRLDSTAVEAVLAAAGHPAGRRRRTAGPAGLTGREITIIRAVLRYLRQAAVAFSDSYMTATLLRHPTIAVGLVRLFEARLDPDGADAARAEALTAEIEAEIDDVQSLDEDRILRNFLAVVLAILRTNYYRLTPGSDPPGTKLRPGQRNGGSYHSGSTFCVHAPH